LTKATVNIIYETGFLTEAGGSKAGFGLSDNTIPCFSFRKPSLTSISANWRRGCWWRRDSPSAVYYSSI